MNVNATMSIGATPSLSRSATRWATTSVLPEPAAAMIWGCRGGAPRRAHHPRAAEPPLHHGDRFQPGITMSGWRWRSLVGSSPSRNTTGWRRPASWPRTIVSSCWTGRSSRWRPSDRPTAGCVNRLTRLFTARLGERAVVSVQNPFWLGSLSEPQPDLTLLRPRPDLYSEAHAEPQDVLLLVEVSSSSAAFDRQVKMPLYAQGGDPAGVAGGPRRGRPRGLSTERPGLVTTHRSC